MTKVWLRMAVLTCAVGACILLSRLALGVEGPAATPTPTAEPLLLFTPAPAPVPPRRPRHASVSHQRQDSDILREGVFQGLFHVRTRSAFDVSPGILKGKVYVTVERPRQALTASHIDIAITASAKCAAEASALLCGFARNKFKVAPEWLVWHLATGWRRFLIIDDGDNYDMGAHLSNLTSAHHDLILDVVETLVRNGTVENTLAWAAATCRQRASAAGVRWVSFVDLDEFIVVPNRTCALSGLMAINADLDAAGAVALPLVEVGHGGQYVDTARTQFERTSFVGGTIEAGGAVRLFMKPSAVPSLPLPMGDGRGNVVASGTTEVLFVAGGIVTPLRTGTADWPRLVPSDAPRVIKFAMRSLAAAIYDALCNNDRTDASDDFSLAEVSHHWQRYERRGYTALDRSITPWLLDVHKIVLQSLGFPATKRRERFAASRGGEHQAKALVAEGVLVPAEGAPPSVVPSNQAIARGDLQVAPERLIAKLTAATLDALVNPPCVNNASAVITFCAYVRNRAKLTLEWILWHRLLGVSRFIVFDDGSTDGLREALQPVVTLGFVTIVDAPSPPYAFKGQPVKGGILAAYGACDEMVVQATGLGADSAYVGYIDSDEFLIFERDVCLPKYVAGLIRGAKGRQAVGVAFPWMEVGHNGEHMDTSITQLARTEFAVGEHDPIGRVKCIVRAGAPMFMETAHAPMLVPGNVIILPDGSTLNGPGWHSGVGKGSPAERKAHLAHYHTRSLASWLTRFLDGFADDDNKVWVFDLDVTVSRWVSAQRKGFDNVLPDSHPSRKLNEKVAALLRGERLETSATPSPASVLGTED
jgi:hypothetical protein